MERLCNKCKTKMTVLKIEKDQPRADLSNVHSARRFKPIIANGLRFLSEKIQQLILLNALFTNTPHDLKPLLSAHPKKNQEVNQLKRSE